MSLTTTLPNSISSSRSVIDTNFTNLNNAVVQKTFITISKTIGADFYTGDYASDDLAFTAAVNALPIYGGTILVKGGTYNFNNTLNIKNHGAWIIGEGFATDFADQPAQQPGVNGITRIQASTTFPTGVPLITFGELGTSKMWTGGGLKDILLVGTKGRVAPGDGIEILNVQSVRIQNCGITKVAIGVLVDGDQPGGISNVLIEHNIIYSTTDIGIRLNGGSQENFVRFNYLSGNTQYGIRVSGIGNTIQSNYIESIFLAGTGYHDGTNIYNEGSPTFIYQNEFLNARRDGIYNAGSTVSIISNTISNSNIVCL